MQDSAKDSPSLVLSYLTLRKAIGVLGISLPFVLSLGTLMIFRVGVPESISGFYYTGMGDVFVGTLCAIGVFLLSYKGYERRDDLAGDFAGAFAIGVALFPTTPPVDPTTLEKAIGAAHLVFAALFFLTLAYFSLCLFTKTDQTTPTPQKIWRNRVYKACGYTIVGGIVLIAVYALLPEGIENVLSAYNPVCWLESIAVVAFGMSWLTKGEAILQDQT
jgi:hypothetical protein